MAPVDLPSAGRPRPPNTTSAERGKAPACALRPLPVAAAASCRRERQGPDGAARPGPPVSVSSSLSFPPAVGPAARPRPFPRRWQLPPARRLRSCCSGREALPPPPAPRLHAPPAAFLGLSLTPPTVDRSPFLACSPRNALRFPWLRSRVCHRGRRAVGAGHTGLGSCWRLSACGHEPSHQPQCGHQCR